MKKASKAIAFAMASAMAVSMAACGGSASSTASGAASGDSASATGNGSYDQITYAYATFNNIPTEEDLDVVEEEINKITREKIGAEITLKPISIADYVNKVSLSLQGGEKIDVYQSLGNFGNCVSTDMCYDISDLIDSCAPETKALLGDKFLDACKVNGKLYGIPTYKPFALTPMFIYRKDIADELGIDMSTVNSVEDVTPILEQVKETSVLSVILIAIVALGCSAAIIFYTRRQIIKPMKDMTEKLHDMNGVTEGFQIQTSYGSQEFLVLRDTFNRMMRENVDLRLSAYKHHMITSY